MDRRNFQLGIPNTTIQKVRLKCFSLHTIKLKHEIQPADRTKHVAFSSEIRNNTDDDETFVKCVIFTDKGIFYVSRAANSTTTRYGGLSKQI